MLALVLNIHDGTGGGLQVGPDAPASSLWPCVCALFLCPGRDNPGVFHIGTFSHHPHIILHFMSEYENEVQFYILVVFYFIFISLNL